jgi:hypothetical protein
MTGVAGSRRRTGALLLGLAEAAVVLALGASVGGPASGQVIDDRFPFIEERVRRGGGGPNSGGLFGNDTRQAPVGENNAKAPPPARKPDAAPLTSVAVLGDSMSDWLAYGLEQAAADSPDIGILRHSRTYSGLIRLDVKSDPRGDYPDWPPAAREMLGADKPNFIVVMIGLNDRRPIKEKAPAKTPSTPAAPGTARQPAPAAPAEAPPAPDKEAAADDAAADEPALMGEPERATPGMISYEFRSDKWVELYTKRIDEMMATLKARNVPVFWVGLPPVRTPKTSGDLSFLNDLYRSRAEKAGITYIDTWDGFVDDGGRFVMQGPDFEGQIRRLRSNDGVHFTQAGARKLAHYVEREIQRSLMTHATPVALPAPEEPAPQSAPAARPGTTAIARPLAGPVMPLTSAAEADELAGGARSTRDGVADATAARVLVRGESAFAPAGRADDFAWPRRGVAPLGADPLVATTTTPMTPMVNPEDQRQVAAASAGTYGPQLPQHRPAGVAPTRQAAVAGGAGAANPNAPRPPGLIGQQTAQQQQNQRRFAPTSQPFFFPFFSRW